MMATATSRASKGSKTARKGRTKAPKKVTKAMEKTVAPSETSAVLRLSASGTIDVNPAEVSKAIGRTCEDPTRIANAVQQLWEENPLELLKFAKTLKLEVKPYLTRSAS